MSSRRERYEARQRALQCASSSPVVQEALAAAKALDAKLKQVIAEYAGRPKLDSGKIAMDDAAKYARWVIELLTRNK